MLLAILYMPYFDYESLLFPLTNAKLFTKLYGLTAL